MNTLIHNPYNFTKTIYKGVPIYWQNIENAPCIHIRIGLTVGALEDDNDKLGISHLLEHLVFDGSKIYPNKKAIKDFSKQFLLDSMNAYTSFSETVYHGKCLPENFPQAFEGLWDIAFNPLLTKESLADEKDVIRSEAWNGYKNKLYSEFLKESTKNIYGNHIRAKMPSPLGFPGSIDGITNIEIKEWHKKHYHKGRLVVLVAGPVTEKNLAYIQAQIDSIPDGDHKEFSRKLDSFPLAKNLRIVKKSTEIGNENEQTSIKLTRILGRNIEKDEIAFAANALLQDILHEELRQKRALCYGVQYGAYTNMDIFTNILTFNLDASKVEEAEKVIYEIVESFKEENKWKKEFEQEKKITLDHIRAKERTTGQIAESSMEMLMEEGKISGIEEMINKVSNITYEEVASYITETFAKDKVQVTIVMP